MIDNLATGRREHLTDHPRLRVVVDTIADRDLISRLFEGFQPDAVVHAAASYKDLDDWYNDTLTNCLGGANIVDAAKRHGVSRFVYFQTALCYGLKPLEQPITLNHPHKPEGSSYAISKTTNELYLELSGIDYVTFRLAMGESLNLGAVTRKRESCRDVVGPCKSIKYSVYWTSPIKKAFCETRASAL